MDTSKKRLAKAGRWLIVLGLLGLPILLIAYLLLLVLFYLSLSGTGAPPTPVSIQDQDVSGLRIETLWLPERQRAQSTSIVVCILQAGELHPDCGSSAFYGQEPTVLQGFTNLTPVGTPQMPIRRAFGPNYEVFAVAQLSASAFDVSPLEQGKQSLDQEEVDFTWTVTPKYSGEQVLNVAVTGVWVPRNGGEPIERPLASHLFHLKVIDPPSPPPPFFSLGQVTVGEILILIVGSLLNVPWIVESIGKRRREKEQKQQTLSADPVSIPLSSGSSSNVSPPSTGSVESLSTRMRKQGKKKLKRR
jgi:hypothetical protein